MDMHTLEVLGIPFGGQNITRVSGADSGVHCFFWLSQVQQTQASLIRQCPPSNKLTAVFCHPFTLARKGKSFTTGSPERQLTMPAQPSLSNLPDEVKSFATCFMIRAISSGSAGSLMLHWSVLQVLQDLALRIDQAQAIVQLPRVCKCVCSKARVSHSRLWFILLITMLCLCRRFKEALAQPFWTALDDKTAARLRRSLGVQTASALSLRLQTGKCSGVDSISLTAQVQFITWEPWPGWMHNVHHSWHCSSVLLRDVPSSEANWTHSVQLSCPFCPTWRT